MATPAAERMRRMRERRKAVPADPILYERADWRLFIDRGTLPQKAGCDPHEIGRAVLKEIVDNALDSGADTVTLDGDERHAIIRDDGPGLDPDDVIRLFAVNRPLINSKLKRLPTRGMLGNGLRVVMGAVAAYGGRIIVTTRGVRTEIAVDTVTGETVVLGSEQVEMPDTCVEIRFPEPFFSDTDFAMTRCTIRFARHGESYAGFSRPEWYGENGFDELIAAAPEGITREQVIRDVFGSDDIPAPNGKPVKIGHLGEETLPGEYARADGEVTIGDARIPYCVEAWVVAECAEREDETAWFSPVILNRSVSLAEVHGNSDSIGLDLSGCGIRLLNVAGAKRARYEVIISLIAPFVRLMTDGKTPVLSDFRGGIERALGKAARAAYRYLVRPPTAMSLVDAANSVMREAYMKASDGGALPAKARQIMYAARGEILRLTGRKKFSDTYFTQVLLPNYLRDNPNETDDWDVVYDARGHLIEPHTSKTVPLGTIAVREYLGERPPLHPAGQIDPETLFPTLGPVNRYGAVLFVEKEGFDELFAAVQLAERYDIATMSTKGMSVVAARKLLDEIADDVDHVFVLHDFDVSGFSILGTLGTDSRRYEFENRVPIVEIGLRGADVEEMGLISETVKVDSREARRETLQAHGATDEEIEFLAPQDEEEDCRRVELNAMTSRQLVDFVEAALSRHHVRKILPDDDVLEQHARRLIKAAITRDTLASMAKEIDEEANNAELPDDLSDQVLKIFDKHPELSWDAALAQILG
jgi:hypothetical protein